MHARTVAAAVGIAAIARSYRRWHVRWGATDAEVASVMPGDDILSDADVSWTRAVTIGAPPAAVWPWLVQAGFGRAGFYSYDLLDNLGRPSATTIRPELQELRLGDPIPMSGRVSDATAFRVRALRPERELVWGKPDSTWAWRLEPVPPSGTRLVTRLRQRYGRGALLAAVLLEVADFPMMRRMLLGIKERAELRAG
jgi:hypothetical protein